MAHISESTINDVLQCGSVNHPAHLSRDTMYFLQAKDGFMAFGCKVCTEITGQPQMHILTVNDDARRIHARTRKAEHIERDPNTSRIVSFR